MINTLRFGFFLFLCLTADHGGAQVMTVTGQIPARKMGMTLIHEHVMVDWIGADSTGYHRWDKQEVFSRALPFIKEAQQYGIKTILDCTPAYLGRDPEVLKMLSKATGVQFLTNTGFYGSGRNKFVPDHALKASVETLAKEWMEEFRMGIDGTGIKPGFIKISVEAQDTLSETHRKLVEAAALTHLKTGLSIVSHTGEDAPALSQIKILRDMGVSPEAFVWTHAQNGTMEGYLAASAEGAWISLDNVNSESTAEASASDNIDWYVGILTLLKKENRLNKILISHDSGWFNVGVPDGGAYKGYTDIFTDLLPALRKNGFTQKEINGLLIENPKKAYALQIRKNKQ